MEKSSPSAVFGACCTATNQVIKNGPSNGATDSSDSNDDKAFQAEQKLLAERVCNAFFLAVLHEIDETKKIGTAYESQEMTCTNRDGDGSCFNVKFDPERFSRRFIFNVKTKYLNKFNDDDDADAFADCCLQISEKVQEIVRTEPRESITAIVAKHVDNKFQEEGLTYKCFVAEIMSHPHGGAYAGTTLHEKSIADNDLFDEAPIHKEEMSTLFPKK